MSLGLANLGFQYAWKGGAMHRALELLYTGSKAHYLFLKNIPLLCWSLENNAYKLCHIDVLRILN